MNKDPFKRKYELCDSMDTALVLEANELGVEPNVLLDAILFSFFWHNNEALKFLYKNK